MRKSRFSEEQIIGIPKEHQAGIGVADLCRKHGISDATFYTWRSKYAGMEVSEAKRLKALEEENAKLKKLLAESMLDVSTPREALEKTSDAQFPEAVRGLGDHGEGLLAASRLRAGRHGAEDLPLCFEAVGRWHFARAAEGLGPREAAVRLQTAVDPLAPGRHRAEPQETVPPL
jgi:putative transposase